MRKMQPMEIQAGQEFVNNEKGDWVRVTMTTPNFVYYFWGCCDTIHPLCVDERDEFCAFLFNRELVMK